MVSSAQGNAIFVVARHTLVVAGAIALAACVNASAKISGELARYGLDQRQATCVGDRLEARLSLAQLRELARAARAYSSNDPNPDKLTAADLARVSTQIRDPQIPVEVASAGASCGLISSLLSR